MANSDHETCLISELHLQSACITGKGLQQFSLLQNVPIDLQVLDLANNDLGNEAPAYLRPVFRTLVSLNLSNTKLGLKGCVDLSQNLILTNQANGHSLKYLDLSNN